MREEIKIIKNNDLKSLIENVDVLDDGFFKNLAKKLEGLQLSSGHQDSNETIKKENGYIVELKNDKKEFNQSVFIEKFKEHLLKSPDVNKAIKKFDGLCQSFCSLIVIYGHDDERIKRLLSYDANKIMPTLDELTKISWLKHYINLLTPTEKKMAELLNIAPASLLNLDEQKEIFNRDENKINREVLKSVLDRHPNDFYIQFSTVTINKDDPGLPKFTSGHSTLIYKTLINDELKYCFFEPNTGLNVLESADDLCILINSHLQEMKPALNFNEIYLMDIESILCRSLHLKKLINERNEKQVTQVTKKAAL